LEFVTVNAGFNLLRSQTRTFGSLWRAGRTTLLLMTAAFASIAMVNLPVPAGSALGGRVMPQTPVPASDKWIALGSDASPRSNVRAAAVDPRAAPKSREVRRRRKPPRAQAASAGRATGHLDRVGGKRETQAETRAL
jgi:hypothetical protein